MQQQFNNNIFFAVFSTCSVKFLPLIAFRDGKQNKYVNGGCDDWFEFWIIGLNIQRSEAVYVTL